MCILNKISNDPFFMGSQLGRVFAHVPLGFIDIGAAGGVHNIALPIANHVAVMAFEPNNIAYSEMESADHSWARFKPVNCALSDQNADKAFFSYKSSVNNSMLKANHNFRQRYEIAGLNCIGEEKLATQKLDDIVFQHNKNEKFWGEFLKVDVQGAEIMIFDGAQRTLHERTVAILVEASFCPIYKNQPLFSELEIYLRKRGFIFYGFHGTHYRSKKFIDKLNCSSRERAIWGDAVFFKDPFENDENKNLNLRQKIALVLSAIILGFYDFSIELFCEIKKELEQTNEEKFRSFINRIASVSPEETKTKIRSLLVQIENSPEHANMFVGKFLDNWYPGANFEEYQNKPEA
jgi:FkbM family methyltransferase